MIDEVKNTPKKWKSVFPKIIIGIVSIVALVEATYGGYMLYEKYKSKFKSINVEIGTSEKVSIKDFIKDEKYLENSKIVTNLDEVDYSKVGEYNVVLSHDDREEEVKLNLIMKLM